MKFTPLSDRALFWIFSPITLPICAIGFLALAPMIGLIWLSETWEQRFGAGHKWKEWVAWHPTRINGWFDDENYGDWVWLERVWRRKVRGAMEVSYANPPVDEEAA